MFMNPYNNILLYRYLSEVRPVLFNWTKYILNIGLTEFTSVSEAFLLVFQRNICVTLWREARWCSVRNLHLSSLRMSWKFEQEKRIANVFCSHHWCNITPIKWHVFYTSYTTWRCFCCSLNISMTAKYRNNVCFSSIQKSFQYKFVTLWIM